MLLLTPFAFCNLQKTGNAIRAIGKLKNLSAASRKSSSGVSSMSSPRPSISGTINYSQNSIQDARMTSVDEEADNNNFLCINDKLKDPRVCNERSDSGFSECSNCSTPSASCVCNFAHIDKSDTIVEEQNSSSNSTSTVEPGEESQTSNSDHDARSEISSLEFDDATKANCDNGGEKDIVLSIRVPTRRELLQNELGVPMSEIERRKVSLENDTIKRSKATTSEAAREEFSLEKLKKTSKVALLMEKFQFQAAPAASSSSFKFKAVTNDDDKCRKEGLTTNNSVVVVVATNDVKMCDLASEDDDEEDSLNAEHETNHNSTRSTPTVMSTSPAATRKSPTNHTTTFRLSDRVREVTERLSKPKQQALASPTTEKTTKANILTKQNSNFARSKEFWKR